MTDCASDEPVEDEEDLLGVAGCEAVEVRDFVDLNGFGPNIVCSRPTGAFVLGSRMKEGRPATIFAGLKGKVGVSYRWVI